MKGSISHIYKNIYIGDIASSYDVYNLLNNKISSILYLGTKNKSNHIIDIYNKYKINHLFLNVNDSRDSNIVKCFIPAWNFIEKNISKDKNILIHCNKGISRSPIIAASYFMKKLKVKDSQKNITDDVLQFIKLNRPCSMPNKHFIKQLKEYEYNNIVNENIRVGIFT